MRSSHILIAVWFCFAWGLNAVAAKVGVTSIPPVFFHHRFEVYLCTDVSCALAEAGFRSAAGARSGGLLHGGFAFCADFQRREIFRRFDHGYRQPALRADIGAPGHGLAKGERVALATLARHPACTFCGVVIFSLDASVSSHLFGVLLLILDAFSMAAGTVLLRRLSGVPPLTMQAWMAVIGIPFLFGTSAIFEGNQTASLLSAPAGAWAALAYTVIAGSLIGHTGYYILLQHYEVSLVGSVLLLEPCNRGVISGRILILGEPFTPLIVIGGDAVTLDWGRHRAAPHCR